MHQLLFRLVRTAESIPAGVVSYAAAADGEHVAAAAVVAAVAAAAGGVVAAADLPCLDLRASVYVCVSV